MQLSHFDFTLPEALIAKHPLPKRSSSKLLYLDRQSGEVVHLHFSDLPDLLAPQDLVVLNNTQVIPARLFAHKPTGGKVEILLERTLENYRLLAQARANKPLKIGDRLLLTDDCWFEIINHQASLYELCLHSKEPINSILEKFGQVPLPPYIKHPPTISDKKRYQTIYANTPGAVAAPTAGLHFDHELMKNLTKKGIQTAFITLHVGLGTFQPVRVEDISKHKMHAEYIDVPKATCDQIVTAKQNESKIVAVGTTCLRALETASQSGEIKPYRGDTDIFIYPGYKFHDTRVLITNFHLPKTSLLMLVAAFAGYENTMHAYREAINCQYRFYSYGDAMIIK